MFLLWIFLALNVTAAAEHKRFRKIWEFLEQNFIFLKKLQSEHDMWGRGQCIDLFYWELQPRAPTEECCIRKFLLRVRDVVPLSRHSHLPVISNSKTLQTKYLTKIFPVNREFSEPSLHQMYLHISGGRVGGWENWELLTFLLLSDPEGRKYQHFTGWLWETEWSAGWPQ